MEDDFIMPEDVDDEIMLDADLRDIDGDKPATDSTAISREQEPRGSKLTVGHCAEAMDDVLRKYREVKQRLADVDRLAMQLSYGIRLQTEMDKCATERKNFPLHIELRRQQLTSGASLLFIQLRNDSPYEIIEWHLTLTAVHLETITETEDEGKVFTKVIPIGRLSKYSVFTHEVFCTNNLSLPLIFRTQLVKCIHLTGDREPRAFRIALEPIYLTHWDLLATVSASGAVTAENASGRAVVYERTDEEQKVTLPEALVYLLCGAKQSETALLAWITGRESATVEYGDDTISCTIPDMSKNSSTNCPLSIQVKKRGLNYDIVLKMRNAKLRNALLDELQLRILIHMRYVWKELKGKEDCTVLPNAIGSMSACFASLIANYRR